jgi:BirA family biotin operon repressor/biotin-[acetyl-CoA-carboxylase] ligase
MRLDKAVFPPLLTAIAEPKAAWRAALRAAERGVDPATLFWSTEPERIQAAILLAPDRPLAACLVMLKVAALALADALAALAPPQVPIAIVPPDRIELDGGLVGGARIAAPSCAAPNTIPEWLVVGFDVAMASGDAPGLQPWTTSLREEGFADIDPGHIAEAFSRHFLARLDQWQSLGEAGLEADWRAWTAGADPRIAAEACLAGPSWAA